MARPESPSISYFPLDTTFLNDLKVRRIIKGCGPASVCVLLYLLINIYGDKGYYMEWNEDVPFLISDQVGVTEGLALETINKAMAVDFFNKEMFKKYNIVTSKGIQIRYLKAAKRRKKIEIKKEYLLCEVDQDNVDIVCTSGVNVDKSEVNVCNNLTNVDRSTQSKVKESKVNKSKVKRDIEKPTRHRHGEYKKVLLSDLDFEKLKKEFPNDYKDRIKRLDEYIEMTGKAYKNHLLVIRNWARKDNNNASSPRHNKQPSTKDWNLPDDYDV